LAAIIGLGKPGLRSSDARIQFSFLVSRAAGHLAGGFRIA
jgi:hypothetical protein